MREVIRPPRGRFRMFQLDRREPIRGPYAPNEVLFSWATVAGQLLSGAPNGRDYSLSMLYVEFSNAGGAVTPPTFDRTGGRSYYDNLAASSTVDYLRVPIIGRVLSSTDSFNFPDGNMLTIYGQTQGVVGVNGKPFTDGAGSRVYGCALVAAPEPNDPTQDLVFSRAYKTGSAQLVKLPTSQIGIDWQLLLG